MSSVHTGVNRALGHTTGNLVTNLSSKAFLSFDKLFMLQEVRDMAMRIVCSHFGAWIHSILSST